jgi:hypothetical protein
MDESELAHSYALLGVAPGADREALKRALMQKNFALIRAGAPEAERERLRAAHDAIVAHFDALEVQQQKAARVEGRAARQEKAIERLVAEMEQEFEEPKLSAWDPRSFDSARVNALAPPLVALAAIGVQLSPFNMFFLPFYIWVHECGHATIGWMTGHRAIPLPLGWTPIAPEKSTFVYFGLLFLFGVLFAAGLRERKTWPMILAVLLAVAQAFMTWRLPPDTAMMWISFGGIGGEFYLSAASVGMFFLRLPEKFRWGACRYFFLFVGAGTFYSTFAMWKRIQHGDEGIPYGSMINGEEDAGGDMNGLHDEWGWTQTQIIHTYNRLGNACLVAMAVVYVFFALRLDARVARIFAR